MREFNGFGDMLEDEVEKSHQDCDRFAQRVARLRSLELRVRSFSQHEKTINNPRVQLTIKEAMEKTSRKRSQGDVLLAKKRSVRAKTERHAKRLAISLRNKCLLLEKATVLTRLAKKNM